MKSVNFWLLTNLIKHVDETFRGAAGSRDKRDPGPELQDLDQVMRSHPGGHREGSLVLIQEGVVCVCVGGVNVMPALCVCVLGGSL